MKLWIINEPWPCCNSCLRTLQIWLPLCKYQYANECLKVFLARHFCGELQEHVGDVVMNHSCMHVVPGVYSVATITGHGLRTKRISVFLSIWRKMRTSWLIYPFVFLSVYVCLSVLSNLFVRLYLSAAHHIQSRFLIEIDIAISSSHSKAQLLSMSSLSPLLLLCVLSSDLWPLLHLCRFLYWSPAQTKTDSPVFMWTPVRDF